MRRALKYTGLGLAGLLALLVVLLVWVLVTAAGSRWALGLVCLLYTSDAADE